MASWLWKFQTEHGNTLLSLASINGHTYVVWELLKHNPWEALARVTDNGRTKISTCLKVYVQNSSQCKDKEKEQARELIWSMMASPASNPVEISMEYINLSITNTKLAMGALEKMYWGQHSKLPSSFMSKQPNHTISNRPILIKFE